VNVILQLANAQCVGLKDEALLHSFQVKSHIQVEVFWVVMLCSVAVGYHYFVRTLLAPSSLHPEK
jgi:hypothetical protein